MNSIWKIEESYRFKTSVKPCDICDQPRTHNVRTIDPFGQWHESYSLCDSPNCLKELSDNTIGDSKVSDHDEQEST